MPRRLSARQDDVLAEVIARCCRLKADVVEGDEREETGLRAVLNYGHTFAHALEAVAGYGQLLAWRGGLDRHDLRRPAGSAVGTN